MNRNLTNATSSNSNYMHMNEPQPRRERNRSTASSATRTLMVLPPSSPRQEPLIHVVEARPPPGLFSWTPRPITVCLMALFALVFCTAALIGASPRGATSTSTISGRSGNPNLGSTRNFPNTHTSARRSSNRYLSSAERATTGAGTSQSSFHYDNLFVKNANDIGSMHSSSSSSSSSAGKTGSQGGTTGGSSSSQSSQLNDYYEKKDRQANTGSPASAGTESTEQHLATAPADARTDSNTANAANTHESIIRRGSSGECSKVPYGMYTKEDYSSEGKLVDLEDMPLNELLIELDHPRYVSPPNLNSESPVIVDIGLYVNAVEELDVGSNSFVMEGYLDLVWCDPRTKFTRRRSMNDPNRKQHMFLEADAAKELEQIWWPSITFTNEMHPREVENQELIIDNDGTIEYREKFVVKLATNYDMHRFPFDSQILIAEIQSFAWNSDIVQFSIEEDLVGFSDHFEIPEHTLTGVIEHLLVRQEPRDRHAFSELVTELYVSRNPTYYLTKVIIPLTLIVGISWAVFWMDPDALADRMGVSFTGVLTSVAYQFVVSDTLPRHVYNTFLDNFVLLTFILMIWTVLVNISTHSLYQKGYKWHAHTVDIICRIFFPLMFIISVAILAGAQIMIDYLPTGGIVGICFGFVLLLFAFLGYLVHVFYYGRKDKKEKTDVDFTEDVEVDFGQKYQKGTYDKEHNENDGVDFDYDNVHSHMENEVDVDRVQIDMKHVHQVNDGDQDIFVRMESNELHRYPTGLVCSMDEEESGGTPVYGNRTNIYKPGPAYYQTGLPVSNVEV